MEPSTAPALETGTLRSDSPDATRAIGRALGRNALPGTVLALAGPLGAGKTQLAKGVAEGLDIATVVNSPTFILMNEHVGRLRLFHVDAYRLGDPEEALAAGLIDDRQAAGVLVIEWADRLAGWLPEDRLDIELQLEPGAGGSNRTVHWTARGSAHERLAADVLSAA
jgi:tRNA threonylcarbamoyladenosine biosynthesis protein TsaE